MCIYVCIKICELCCVGTVHRYYESRRCLFNDEKPGRKEKAEKIKAKAKKIQQQKCVSIARYIEDVTINIESLTAIQHVEEAIEESV